ncbi:DUF6942 family protein [Catenovulum sediminis]|uniref:Uncharacterized protein n=1 Tax=Catenovulum sediminis TaxID=1740262 RepID=A0ABV1RGQ1_9ALTE
MSVLNYHPFPVGLGDVQFDIAVYIENRPPLEAYLSLYHLKPLEENELDNIVTRCSNNWRKIFNCYAKLLYQLNTCDLSSWQQYRDQLFLKEGANAALLFSAPLLATTELKESKTVHVISGRTYASKLNLPTLDWLAPDFAINRQHKIIVSPYFDYRQLSNIKIEQLAALIRQLRI